MKIYIYINEGNQENLMKKCKFNEIRITTKI